MASSPPKTRRLRRVLVKVRSEQSFTNLNQSARIDIDKDAARFAFGRFVIVPVADIPVLRDFDPCGGCPEILRQILHGVLLQRDELLNIIEVAGFTFGKEIGCDASGVVLQREERIGNGFPFPDRNRGQLQAVGDVADGIDGLDAGA